MNYLIKKGDNLYQIAKKYNISVEEIIKNNFQLNPYNLTIGKYIYIPMNSNFEQYNQLKENMRIVWEQHVFWTRLLIISIVEHLNDELETTDRLLRNAKNLADLYRPYYGNEIADTIDRLINEHLVIASKLVHAIVNNDMNEANTLNENWYKNADDIASALSSINPYYNKEEVRKMLYIHLDLTKEEVMNRLNHNYKKEIEIFDNIEKEAIMMSNYFTQGIQEQFN